MSSAPTDSRNARFSSGVGFFAFAFFACGGADGSAAFRFAFGAAATGAAAAPLAAPGISATTLRIAGAEAARNSPVAAS